MATFKTRPLVHAGEIYRSGSIIEEVILSERYFLHNVKKESPSEVRNMLRRCNMLWSFIGEIDEKNKDGLMIDSGESGLLVSPHLFNHDLFIELMTGADSLDVNGVAPELDTMPPLGKMMRGLVYTKTMARNYMSAEKNLAFEDPVRALTKHVRPAGVLLVDNDALKSTHGLNLLNGTMLKRGFVNRLNSASLRLPLDLVTNPNLCKLDSGDLHAYFVVGPGNELLVGSEVGTGSRRAHTTSQVVKSRMVKSGVDYAGVDPTKGVRKSNVKDVNVLVHDQQLAGSFVITRSTATIDSVLQEAAARCKKYTRCRNLVDKAARTVGAIKLGVLHYEEGRYRLEENGDGGKSLVFKNFFLSPDTKWRYLDFFYEKSPYNNDEEDRDRIVYGGDYKTVEAEDGNIDSDLLHYFFVPDTTLPPPTEPQAPQAGPSNISGRVFPQTTPPRTATTWDDRSRLLYRVDEGDEEEEEKLQPRPQQIETVALPPRSWDDKVTPSLKRSPKRTGKDHQGKKARTNVPTI